MANFISKKKTVTFDDAPTSMDDPLPFCCAWHSESGRCHNAGSMSSGGGFFCHDHFFRNQKKGISLDDVVRKSHIDFPNPDFSMEARRKYFRNKTNREMMEWLQRHSEKAPKTSEVISKLVA